MIMERHYNQEEIKEIMGLQEDSKRQMLEHIGKCDQCSMAFASYIEHNCLVEASNRLRVSIKGALQQRRRVYYRELDGHKKRQLWIYSTKVVLTAGVAIFMVFGMDTSQITNREIRHNQTRNVITATIDSSVNSFVEFFDHCFSLKRTKYMGRK